MKQLKCEMCGSPDLIKQNGVFVCQSCGCKYSIEEARKLMVEGTIKVTGTVKVDNSKKIGNMLINAKRAYSDGKYAEAERLFGQILVEDPENATAILYQGLSIGWQGNTVRYYMDKTGAATERAITIAHAQMKDGPEFASFVNDALVKTRTLGEAILNLCVKNINAAADSLNREISIMKSTFSGYSDPAYYMRRTNEAKDRMNNEVDKQYRIIDNTMLIVVSSYKKALDNLSNVDVYPVVFYNDMKSYLTGLVNLGRNVNSKMFVTKANDLCRTIDQYLQKKTANEQLAKKKAIEQYWAKHKKRKNELDKENAELASEKKELIEKQNSLNEQISDIKKSLNEPVASRKEIETIKEKISQLTADRAKLWFFKGKEKKAIDEKIAELESKTKDLEPVAIQQETEKKAELEQKLSSIQDLISPISKRIKEIENRCKEINSELTKER